MSMALLLPRMKYDITSHGFRSTFSPAVVASMDFLAAGFTPYSICASPLPPPPERGGRVDHHTLLIRNGFTYYPQKAEEIRCFPGDIGLRGFRESGCVYLVTVYIVQRLSRGTLSAQRAKPTHILCLHLTSCLSQRTSGALEERYRHDRHPAATPSHSKPR